MSIAKEKTIDDLEEGDEVIFAGSAPRYRRFIKIKKITTTQIVLHGGDRYKRGSGREIGGTGLIIPATDEHRREAAEAIKQAEEGVKRAKQAQANRDRNRDKWLAARVAEIKAASDKEAVTILLKACQGMEHMDFDNPGKK